MRAGFGLGYMSSGTEGKCGTDILCARREREREREYLWNINAKTCLELVI